MTLVTFARSKCSLGQTDLSLFRSLMHTCVFLSLYYYRLITHAYCIRAWLLVDSAFNKTMFFPLNTMLEVHWLGKGSLCSTNLKMPIVSLAGSGHKNFILIGGFLYVRNLENWWSSSHIRGFSGEKGALKVNVLSSVKARLILYHKSYGEGGFRDEKKMWFWLQEKSIWTR